MKNVLVSVIVPVYKTEPYLRKCLDSLLNQSLQELEVVAVDDGSPDRCPEILDEYKEKYPDRIVVLHKENGGQASARNMAFSYCNGKYIGFLDSDDYVTEEMFQKMYERACESDADYVACGYKDVTIENSKEIVLQEYVASKVASTPEELFIGALASPFLHLYKRELIVENKITFPEGVVYEDTAFYLDLIPHIHKLAVIEEPLAVRLRRSNSTMTTFAKDKVDNIFQVITCSLDYYKNNGFYEKYRNELEYFCVRVLLCSSMQRISCVSPYTDARALQKKTLRFVKENFPEYRKNPLMSPKGIHLYMKCFNYISAPVILSFLRLRNRFKRSYS